MMFGFNNKKKGYGSGRGVPGFSRGRKGTIGRGNFDQDRKPNRGDCDPFNWKKQDGGKNYPGPFKDKPQPKKGLFWKQEHVDNLRREKGYSEGDAKAVLKRWEEEKMAATRRGDDYHIPDYSNKGVKKMDAAWARHMKRIEAGEFEDDD